MLDQPATNLRVVDASAQGQKQEAAVSEKNDSTVVPIDNCDKSAIDKMLSEIEMARYALGFERSLYLQKETALMNGLLESEDRLRRYVELIQPRYGEGGRYIPALGAFVKEK